MVRITQNMLSDTTLFNLRNNIARVTDFQNQLSTGRRYDSPSENPIDFPRSLSLRADISQTQTYQRNTVRARSALEHTESALGSTTDVLQEIRTLAVEGASDFDVPARQALAEQVSELYGQLLDLSNTNIAGQFIFGGSTTDQTPFVQRDGAVIYEGDNSTRQISLSSNSQVATNVTGQQTFLHTPNQITSSIAVNDVNEALSRQLAEVNPNFPNLPPLPQSPPNSSTDLSPNPDNSPGVDPNNLARFTVHGKEVRIDLSTDSLVDVVNRINANVEDVTASINRDNQLVITSHRSDPLAIEDGPNPVGFQADPPSGINLMGALGMHRTVNSSRSLGLGYPAENPLTDPTADPTPPRAPVRVEAESFLFAQSNTGPDAVASTPFPDNLALTDLDAEGNEAFVDEDTPAFIDDLESIRITIDDDVIDIDLRALSQGADFDGVPGSDDDVPGSTLGDLVALINNHPELDGRATAYINPDGSGLSITATESTDVFNVENIRKAFGRDLTTRVEVDAVSGETTVTRTEPITDSTLLEDLPGALVDPATGSLGIRQPDPMPAGQPPSNNEGFIVIQNNGQTEAVDLREAETIGDVIDIINDTNVGVRAEINASQTGINVVSTAPNNEPLSIVDMNEGTVARDLGLFQAPGHARLQSNPGFVPTDLVGDIAPDANEGTFGIEVRDGAGETLETYRIDVAPTDTLQNIVDRIDEADGVPGPGGGLISANLVNGQLNIVSNYENHTILVDPAQDTTETDPTRQFTRAIGLDGYTVVDEATVDPAEPYVSEQDTASVLGLAGEGDMDEIEEHNLFRTVKNLERALRDDNTAGIQQALADIDVDLEQILISRTQLGARLNRVEAADSHLKMNEDFFKEELSKTEDVDFAEATTEFSMAQTAYQASLRSSSILLQQTLLDFLA